MRCPHDAPTDANPSTGLTSQFSLTSENSLPSAPDVWIAIAIIAGMGPAPMMKINTRAMTISGIARMMSIERLNSGMPAGQKARPRVEKSESKRPIIAPIKVATAAMFMVSTNDGMYCHSNVGRPPISDQASPSTSAGKSNSLSRPSKKPPAFRLSAV